MLRFVFAGVLVLALGAALYVLGARQGWFGEHRGTGQIAGTTLPEDVIQERQDATRATAAALGAAAPKQILFGDLHVHTTFSTDAFLWSLPIYGGEGVHPLADACDYARYCSALDFWSITDHAEASTPRRWAEAKESIRQCNARGGGGDNPDVVAMLGFEWTQVGRIPDEHYGHKNVIFKHLEDDKVAARPIAASGPASQTIRGTAGQLDWRIALSDFSNRQAYYDFRTFMDEVREIPDCPADRPSDELPKDCYETAGDPGDLVRRLEAQELDYLLIPHGTSWGFYTPPATTLDKQLSADMRPEVQEVIEVMSGHGNSEEYRDWEEVEVVDAQNLIVACPAPRDDYLPSCWQAGEIIRDRCAAAGHDEATCEARAADAREAYANLGVAGHLVIEGADPADWLDAGQCRDCFLPPFNHRPKTSVQYGLAISNFDDGLDSPRRFNWGFIASSDNHRARPGTGYKAYDRKRTTEASGPRDEAWFARIFPDKPANEEALPLTREALWNRAGFNLLELERQASFWTTGGLAAVHADGRSRAAIWEALKRREVYGTSGPRILLWFDHLSENGAAETPMGGTIEASAAPRFRVRAAGAFTQQAGCPDFAAEGLPGNRLEKLCRGECYNPSGERHRITRIEIVRIRPQVTPDEDVADLIEDVWRSFPCPQTGAGCSVEFDDPDFAVAGRDALYYARAIQEPTETVNGANLRCEFDENGNCVKVDLCHGDYRTADDDDCLAAVEHRAWSSPIYVRHTASAAL